MNEENKETHVWDKMEYEPIQWFSRFDIYLHQDLPRNLLDIYRKERARKGLKPLARYVAPPGTWRHAKDKYQWEHRTREYDNWKIGQEKKLREQEEREHNEHRRRMRLLEEQEEINLAELMRKKTRELLDLPVKEELVKYSKSGMELETILVPEHRAFVAAATLAREARSHARGALQMVDKVERIEQTGKDGGPIETDNTQRVTTTETERLSQLLELAKRSAES